MASKSHGFRRQVMFWLDESKPKQATLASEIDKLKSQRRFATVLRRAMLLYLSLERGETDLLLSEFPFLADRLEQGGNGDGNGGKIERLERQIEQLTAALMSQNNGALMHNAISETSETYRQPAATPAPVVQEKPRVSMETVAKNALSANFDNF